ncbi:MAG: zinc-finger domain-containing protein [Rickettsiales bacterium]|nr:zinc-finger domain-containing protein [Rickettsiales bacterium]
MATPMPVFETVPVHHLEVVCDGSQGALGHPRVYLHIESEEGFVVCPYCSRSFVYTPHDAPTS